MHATLPHSPLHVRGLADVEERVDQGHVYEMYNELLFVVVKLQVIVICYLLFEQYCESARDETDGHDFTLLHRSLALPAALSAGLHSNGCPGWALSLHGSYCSQRQSNVWAHYSPLYGTGKNQVSSINRLRCVLIRLNSTRPLIRRITTFAESHNAKSISSPAVRWRSCWSCASLALLLGLTWRWSSRSSSSSFCQFDTGSSRSSSKVASWKR